MNNVKNLITVRNIYFLVSLFFFGYLLYYYWTGAGGAKLLATRLVPTAIIIYILSTWQKGNLYPRLGDTWNRVLYVVYILISLSTMVYLFFEYENLFLYRAGSYNTLDIFFGTIFFLLVMEISRKLHSVLFWVNAALILYSLFGYLSPIDFFWHPGASFTRIITVSTIEFHTGVFGRYAQMALTLIAAFLLIAAVARSFGAQEAILQTIYSAFGKNKYNVPQVAVLSSASIGSVSGSGAANTAVTGSFTIPLMIRHGIPPVYAGAVETAASMGGLIMPPLMAVAGFIMADMLGVPYWEVVLRGFGMAFIYFAAVVMSVYLLSVRSIMPEKITPPPAEGYKKLSTLIFFGCVVFLIVLMGFLGRGAMRSAAITAFVMLGILILVYFYYRYIVGEKAYQKDNLLIRLRDVVEIHAEMAWYLVILLVVLGIMIGLFTATGFIVRMGELLMQLGELSLFLTVLVAFAFGWLAGTGLPPTATYVIVAVIVAAPFQTFGINPWITHFFVFLLAVWGELSPPTSLTAAVASRLAEASFIKIMFTALKICAPIIILSFSIFVRKELVVEAGLMQIASVFMVSAGVLAFTFAFFGTFSHSTLLDYLLKGVILVLSLVTLFYASFTIAAIAAGILALMLAVGVRQHKKIFYHDFFKETEKSAEVA
ncbi:MAG: TRAP transporter permease [Desulfosalsimonas sp.]